MLDKFLPVQLLFLMCVSEKTSALDCSNFKERISFYLYIKIRHFVLSLCIVLTGAKFLKQQNYILKNCVERKELTPLMCISYF